MKIRVSRQFCVVLVAAMLVGPGVSVGADEKRVPASRADINLSFAPLVKSAAPAVVNIYTRRVVRSRRTSPLFNDPFFRRFFGNQFPPGSRENQRVQNSLGSGVIVSADGLIVTNHHVIDKADEITVVLTDRREFEAEVVTRDDGTDLAVLRIKSNDEKLPFLKLRDSDTLEVGDLVLAIGNPFGVGQTVTSGIVSALARTARGVSDFGFFIQTDAAINPGNSGGALISLDGGLIGINTAILGASGGNVGIGFAIPSTMMKNLVDQIIEHGEVRRGSLGISGRPLDAGLAKAQQLDVKQGAYVMQVMDDTAASKAGIKAGDVIISVDGTEISGFHELRSKIATLGEGKKVKLGIYRDGKVKTVNVTLDGASAITAAGEETHPAFQGATLENTQKSDGKGVEVTGVQARSPAARVGLEEGDVIMQVNRQRVETIRDMNKIIENTKGNIVLGVKRGRELIFVLIQ